MNLEGDWTLLGVGSVCFDAWWLRLGSLLTVPVPGLGAFIAGVLQVSLSLCGPTWGLQGSCYGRSKITEWMSQERPANSAEAWPLPPQP